MKEDLKNSENSSCQKKSKQPVTINLSSDVVLYFKEQSKKTGLPYQTLINMYLTDCMKSGRELKVWWE